MKTNNINDNKIINKGVNQNIINHSNNNNIKEELKNKDFKDYKDCKDNNENMPINIEDLLNNKKNIDQESKKETNPKQDNITKNN